MNGLQILGRHDVFIIHFKFYFTILVAHFVGSSTNLHTSAPIGRSIHFVQAKVTFTGYRHTEGTVAEHLNADKFTLRSPNLFLLNHFVYFTHLSKLQFAGQYHYIGKAGIELQSLSITDIQLGRQMYFLTHFVAIRHYRYISRNHRTDACFLSRIDNGTHQSNVFIVYYGVDSKITLDTVLIAYLRNLPQIVDGKRAGRTGTHVQALNAKIDGIGTCLDGCCKGFARAHRSHYFEVFYVIHKRFVCSNMQR